ncbi:helix-turn-helix domain-containing protein [Clostridiaceae bacterium 68-1-5]|uniref:Helix-turn-helix domain-containing protein n=1 Tax=Suipraeoptans intestinalis TaxID=2606628 RepID=A0A6N7UST9_9FIRM|nr:helix-turn-helix domain-containing protein [Suipraeoptans intestinalis]MSR93948.1 helix-turn-helix domain-containing protein [Suipraeoptans intestinalis]MSR94923.1 helix-turn-helix domain-containing protein [Suipraeoptans intestinalis]
MELLEYLGRNVVRLREKKGMEQKDLALLLERSPSTLCSLEKGRVYPHFSMVERLQRIFEVDVLELLGSEEEIELWKSVQLFQKLLVYEGQLRRFSEAGEGEKREEAKSLLYALMILREAMNGVLEKRLYELLS